MLRHARDMARATRRILRLSPMCAVIREVRRRGVAVEQCDALECFAFTGAMHTLDYARVVRNLEVWEINAAHESRLRKHFPGAQVRITDTYDELARSTRRFDMIVVDNSPAHGSHIEHFDLFPGVFRLMKDSCVLVLDVIPSMNGRVRRQYPEMFREEVLRTRAEFYGVADPRMLSEDALLAPYAACARRQGYELRWHFLRKRNSILTYLVLYVVRGRA
jgi:hypothetical protein